MNSTTQSPFGKVPDWVAQAIDTTIERKLRYPVLRTFVEVSRRADKKKSPPTLTFKQAELATNGSITRRRLCSEVLPGLASIGSISYRSSGKSTRLWVHYEPDEAATFRERMGLCCAPSEHNSNEADVHPGDTTDVHPGDTTDEARCVGFPRDDRAYIKNSLVTKNSYEKNSLGKNEIFDEVAKEGSRPSVIVVADGFAVLELAS